MKGRIQNDKNVYYDIIKPDNSEMLSLYTVACNKFDLALWYACSVFLYIPHHEK